MALANRRTTLLLVGIAVVFTIVLIILCLTPPSTRPQTGGQHDPLGRRPPTIPEVINGTDPTTSTEDYSTTTTAKTTKTATTEKSTTQSSTTEMSTTENNDEMSSAKTTAATTTPIQEPTTSTGSSPRDTSTETTYADNQTSTSTERHGASSPSDASTETTHADNQTSTSTERHGASSPSDASTETTHADNQTSTSTERHETTTGSDTTPSDATDTTVWETNDTTLDDTTTDEVNTDTTTEEVTNAEITTEELDPETKTEEPTFNATTTEATTVTVTPVETTTTPQDKGNETECSHPDCKKLAARMLDMMDHSASPCKDFYQYACGGVEDNPFLHPEDPEKDVNDRILRTLQFPSNDSIGVGEPAREYFKSCVGRPPVPSKDDLALLQGLVSRLGLLDPRTLDGKGEKYAYIDEDAFDLQKMLADFIKYDFAPFFEVGIDVDKTDQNKFSVRLSLPLNGYDSGFSKSIDTSHCKSLYEQTLQEAVRERKDLNITLEYEKLHACRETGDGHGALIGRLKKATKALNLTAHIDEASLADRLLDDTVYNAEFFVEEIKEYWPAFHDLRHQIINKNYTEYRVGDLDSRGILTNQVKWGELLETIVGRPVDTVQVYHEHELWSVFNRISEEKPANLRNMLLMLWASRLYTDLVAPVTSSPNSPEYCASVTRYLVPDMAAVIYLQSFSKEDLDHMKEKVDRVVNSVKNTVTEALYLTPGVSKDLIDKLQHTFTELGGAEQLHMLSESVSNSNQQLFLTGPSYVARSLDLLKRRRKNLYSLLGNETGSHTAMWNYFSVPYSVTATTVYGTNTILIPEGVMAPPLMYPALAALPNYLLYAGIGHLVAHEFLHAIDTTGIKFDAMTGAALKRPPLMDARENCSMQFLNSEFSQPLQKTSTLSFRLPARIHLNELMADSGATRLAWLAYIHGETAKAGKPMAIVTDAPSRRRRRNVLTTDSHEKQLPWLGMTPYQLYLLKTAQTQCARTSDIDVVAIMEQEHLPARLRVNLAMVNEPLFAEAFECPVGSTMRAPYPCPYVVSHMPGE